MSSSVATTRSRNAGGERIELHHVGPRREVRIASPGDHAAGDLDEPLRLLLDVGSVAADEELGMLDRPRVVGRDVVRHEVEEQPHAASGQGLPRDRETVPAAEPRIDLVAPNAVRRADDVGCDQIGKGRLEACHQLGVPERDLDARRAALPHPHQPHRVQGRRRDAVPLGLRNPAEGQRLLGSFPERCQPRPRVDLVDPGMSRPAEATIRALPGLGHVRIDSASRRAASTPIGISPR